MADGLSEGVRILIGGSPSTGSSLFRRILNRHPRIFCGPETNIFAHRKLFTDWSYYKRFLIPDNNKKLKSEFWSLYYGPELSNHAYGWNEPELSELINASSRFIDFCDRYFTRNKRANPENWAEKSPGNVFNFDLFLLEFKPCLVIHTVRDPLDTIASLLSRGMDLYHALGVILMHNAFAMKSAQSSRYLMVRYEDLVKTPVLTLERVCRHLSLPFSESMLVPFPEEKVEIGRMQGWNFEETGRIQEGSVGRYKKLGQSRIEHILVAMNAVSIKESYAKKYALSIKTFQELAEVCGYDHLDVALRNAKNNNIGSLHLSRLRNRFSRWRRGFEPWFKDNHPIVITS
jgi:hypothetical protein